MINLNVEFKQREFKKLWKIKESSKYNWHDFIMYLVLTSELENKIMAQRLALTI